MSLMLLSLGAESSKYGGMTRISKVSKEVVNRSSACIDSLEPHPSQAVYHDGVFRIPNFVRNSGMKIPAAPNIAHLQYASSACWFHFKVSGSDPAIKPGRRGATGKPEGPFRDRRKVMRTCLGEEKTTAAMAEGGHVD